MLHLDNSINATLEINKESNILKGHFPGQPVLPGACMLQIVKEVLISTIGVSMRLKKVDHLKFIKLIDPRENNMLQLTLSYRPFDYNMMLVVAHLISDKSVFFKLKGSFIAE